VPVCAHGVFESNPGSCFHAVRRPFLLLFLAAFGGSFLFAGLFLAAFGGSFLFVDIFLAAFGGSALRFFLFWNEKGLCAFAFRCLHVGRKVLILVTASIWFGHRHTQSQ
jgi:hypothetical protein